MTARIDEASTFKFTKAFSQNVALSLTFCNKENDVLLKTKLQVYMRQKLKKQHYSFLNIIRSRFVVSLSFLTVRGRKKNKIQEMESENAMQVKSM